jgi:hypothetical protein
VGKSVTVPGKCYAISDGDRQDDPLIKRSKQTKIQKVINPFLPMLTKRFCD